MTPAQWDEARLLFEKAGWPLNDIAQRFRVSADWLTYRVRKQGWVRTPEARARRDETMIRRQDAARKLNGSGPPKKPTTLAAVALVSAGLTYGQAAAKLGVTRNVVAGAANRAKGAKR